MKIAYLGTPSFAVAPLEMLIKNGFTVDVFTQPDRPVGRSKIPVPPPAKVVALSHGLKVYQPESIKLASGMDMLLESAPDLMVTAAWGQLLSKENLDVPRYGCINVHGSLLPKLRGASPIQTAIINGDAYSGITTMMTQTGLDTGDMLLSESVKIDENETADELSSRLSIVGASVLEKTIAKLLDGTLVRVKQDDAQKTLCKLLKKEDGRIDFNMPARDIHNLVRGTYSWPGAFCTFNGETVKIHKTRIIDQSSVYPGQAGQIVAADKSAGIIVNTGHGLLEILELQFASSKRMDAKACVLGRKLLGERFV